MYVEYAHTKTEAAGLFRPIATDVTRASSVVDGFVASSLVSY